MAKTRCRTSIMWLIPSPARRFWKPCEPLSAAKTQTAITDMDSKNVQKRKARPKRSIQEPGEDHPLGLWIDKDLLRKHHVPTVHTTMHDPLMVSSQRYLELADLA